MLRVQASMQFVDLVDPQPHLGSLSAAAIGCIDATARLDDSVLIVEQIYASAVCDLQQIVQRKYKTENTGQVPWLASMLLHVPMPYQGAA